MLRYLKDKVAEWERMLEALARQKYDPAKDNPIRKARKRFWLVQLANFIANFVFRVPREFTPTVAFPFGASRLAKEFDESVVHNTEVMKSQFEEGKRITQQTLDCFRVISDSVKTDDAKVIAFCASCVDIKHDRIRYRGYVQYANSSFQKLAALAYLNNAPFSCKVYDTKNTMGNLVGHVSGIIDSVSELYLKATA